MRVLAAGAAYFGLVFAVGFALGTVRVLLVVPHLGERTAELLELPLMIAASLLSARFVLHRARLERTSQRLATGLVALALMLTAELTLVLTLRDLTLAEYVASRDPLSGSAYLLGLAVFAAAPVLVGSSAPRS